MDYQIAWRKLKERLQRDLDGLFAMAEYAKKIEDTTGEICFRTSIRELSMILMEMNNKEKKNERL